MAYSGVCGDMTTRFQRLRRLPRAARAFVAALHPEPDRPQPDHFELEIDRLTQSHRVLKKEVSRVVYARNKLSARMDSLKVEIGDLLDAGDTQGRKRKRELEVELERIRPQHDELHRLGEKVKRALLALQGEIERVKKTREQAEVTSSLRKARDLVDELEAKGLL